MYYFLVSTNPIDVKKVIDNANKIGIINNLLRSVFVLATKEEYDVTTIRSVISSEHTFDCLIIKLDEHITSAWRLQKNASSYFKSIFSDIYGEKTEQQ